jgi:hypothetical protein
MAAARAHARYLRTHSHTHPTQPTQPTQPAQPTHPPAHSPTYPPTRSPARPPNHPPPMTGARTELKRGLRVEW